MATPKAKANKPLTAQQSRFVDEYVKDQNAKQAAIRAGYSPKTAETQGSRLCRNAQVRAEIDRRLNKVADDCDVQAADILNELKLIGHSDPAKVLGPNGYLLPLNEMPEEIRRCIASVDMGGDGGTKIRFWPKTTALELLGKYRKLWTDKVLTEQVTRIVVENPFAGGDE